MKKVIINPLVIVMLVALTMLACSSKYPGYDKTATGLYYKLYKVSKDTVKAKLGDWVSLDMRYKYKDSTLFNSKVAMGTPVRFQLPASDFKGDIYEGIRMLSPGDSADFIVNADSLFTKTFRQPKRPNFVDTNSVVHFYITMISIESPAKMMQNEEDALKKYIEEKKITVAPQASGLYYIETLAGKGAKVDTGVWVKLNFTVSLIDGKQIFSTLERGEPMEFEFGKKFDTPGFEEGVSKMLKGGKSTLIVPSKIAFGETGRGSMVPPYATVIYDVEIVDLQSKADHDKQVAEKKKTEAATLEKNKTQEKSMRDKYLSEHKISVKPTASGLYFVEKIKGTGAKAGAGKKVKVQYTGTLLDGTKFDSSKDSGRLLEFTIGNREVIQGMEEGITLMNVGSKAILVIPSNIAYGERGNGTKIQPYSTLVFEVELMDVK